MENFKKNLTQEEINTLKTKCGIEFSEPTVTSDDLILYVPQEYPIDGDDCRFVLSTDSEGHFVVSYDRPQDMYTCMTITGTSLCDVLYNTIVETCSI